MGGADVHCKISGCTDHYAVSEEEAMITTRHIIESLNLKIRVDHNRLPTGEITICNVNVYSGEPL